MNVSDSSERANRKRARQTVVIRRDDHIGDPIGIAWLAPADTAGDAIINRLSDYLGRRVKIIKAEISRDKIEVELEARGWPDEATRLARAARDLYEKGARRNALSMCREALELDSLNLDAMTTLGLILSRLGQDKEALGAFKHAREFGAAELEVILAMAECALRLGRLGTAAQYAHEALRIDSRSLAARRVLKAIKHEQ